MVYADVLDRSCDSKHQECYASTWENKSSLFCTIKCLPCSGRVQWGHLHIINNLMVSSLVFLRDRYISMYWHITICPYFIRWEHPFNFMYSVQWQPSQKIMLKLQLLYLFLFFLPWSVSKLYILLPNFYIEHISIVHF